jgi:hypothetical protein
MNAIGAERGDLLRRNVEWRLEISDTLSDGYFTGDGDPPVGEGKLCVSATCGGAGYFRIGAALDALEQESSGLGAAFYWSLVRSLYRVMRIYDHDDALMYEEQSDRRQRSEVCGERGDEGSIGDLRLEASGRPPGRHHSSDANHCAMTFQFNLAWQRSVRVRRNKRPTDAALPT